MNLFQYMPNKEWYVRQAHDAKLISEPTFESLLEYLKHNVADYVKHLSVGLNDLWKSMVLVEVMCNNLITI